MVTYIPDMMTPPEKVPQLVKTLRRTYARKLGAVRAGEGDSDALRADLEHLAAVIRMFHPGQDFAAIRPVRPHTNRRDGKWGAVWFVAALDVLRTASEPLTAQEIVARIMKARGEPLDGPAFVSAECSLLQTLSRRSEVVRVGARRPFRWMIA